MEQKIIIDIWDDHVAIKGHSYPDICAAVSSVMYTSVNLCTKFNHDSIHFMDDDEVVQIIKLRTDDSNVNIVWMNMISMFKDIVDGSDGNVIFNDNTTNKDWTIEEEN